MQGEDDLRGLAKIMAFMRAVSIIIVLMHLYWFCYGFFIHRGWTLEIINKILGNFNRTAGLFEHTLYTKVFALILLVLSCLGPLVCLLFLSDKDHANIFSLLQPSSASCVFSSWTSMPATSESESNPTSNTISSKRKLAKTSRVEI